MAFVKENREALQYELLLAGYKLEWLGSARLNWQELKVFVKYAGRESAMVKDDVSPGVAEWTTLHDMVRNIEYAVQLLVWSKTVDGQHNRNRPERRPDPSKPLKPVMALEGEGDGPHLIGGEGVEIAVMRARLGWDENDQLIREKA